jgi:diguanylate cyclase (GGDEF)-like protein
MIAPREQDRVLIVAAERQRQALAALFAVGGLSGWEMDEAEDLDEAHLILQHNSCDVLLVDENACPDEPIEGLAALREQHRIPVVLLVRSGPEFVAAALERGVQQWLPRHLALAHPDLLAAALDQARRWGELTRTVRHAGEALHECRRQVSRLVGLLSETIAVDPQTHWFTQRHMLERLQEEVHRAERYHNPLTVVLGEFSSGSQEESPGAQQLAGWAAQRIGRAKRRCDVAGRYGTHRFLLLLPHTPESGAVSCCRRLKSVLGQPPHPIAVRFGIATYSEKTPSSRSLLSRAEECLEQALTAGDDRITC